MSTMTAVRDVRRVVGLWRGRSLLLSLGAAIAVAALLCGVALTVLAGGLAVGGVAGVVGAAILLRVLGVGRIVLRYVERLVTHDATFRALADLRIWFFRRLAASAAGGIGFRRSGDLLSRLVGDVEALDSLYLRVAVPLLGAAVLLPCLIVVIGREDWPLALVIGVLFATAALVLPAIAARSTLLAGERLSLCASALRVSVLDAVGGLREVRVFGAEGRVLANMQGRESRLIAAQLDLARRSSLADAAAFLVGQAALFAVLVAIAAGMAGGVPFAAVTVFLVLVAFELAGGMPRAGVLAGNAAAAARRVVEAAGGAQADVGQRTTQTPASNVVRLDRVSFGWTQSRPVLRDLSLEVPAGARVAILGPSGSGKSTIAGLLLGVARPDAGRITLGGVDVTSLPAETLRGRVALLSQATHLFADTIRANLLIGRRSATEDELWAALDAAAIGGWVRSLPDKLDTWLGEAGATVSGGQGRRLALARTLLSNASVIILDEPASGLDGETERAFLSTLFAGAERRTIVLIAHRLTGVERLDRIWRLQGGAAVSAAA